MPGDSSSSTYTRDDRLAALDRRVQRRVIAHPQVVAEPDDGRRGAHGR